MTANRGSPSLSPSDDVAHDGSAARRGNRRRLLVFLGVFLPCLLVGTAWNLMRPAEYRTVARVQVTLPPLASSTPASGPATGADGLANFVGQVQLLGSRPLIEQVVQRLAASGQRVQAETGDAVSRLHSMIAVEPVPGSTVIQMSATGAPPALLAAALNELIAVYRERLLATYTTTADRRLEQTRDELARLDQQAAQRRGQLERFRGSSGIQSTERDENETVARSRGLATALNNAVEKQATAEARLRALQEAVDAGRGATQARDDPTLASMENRASQLREELREMGRTYTDEFLDRDPRARALRTRLSEMEAQIAQRRTASQELALARAQEEVAGARANVERLQAQMAAQRQGLSNFSVRFAQAKALEEDLASIERARREALERLARLEANEKARQPAVDVLQPAAVPDTPWQPDYWRDGGFVLAGSFGLGLLAMGFVELFNRPPPARAAAPMTVVLPPSWPAIGAAGGQPRPALAPSGVAAIEADVPPPGGAALPAPLPAELTQAEAAALVAAARGPARLACAAWLSGLETAEVTALKVGDVDRPGSRLRVRGAWARDVPVPAWFVDEVPADAAADAPLLRDGNGQPMSAADLETLLACAAIDAGLPDAGSTTPERLRHSAIAWLLREGLRFAALPERVGRIDAPTLNALATLAAGTARRPDDEVQLPIPALRVPPSN